LNQEADVEEGNKTDYNIAQQANNDSDTILESHFRQEQKFGDL
jgi:hypothetical protein